MAARILIADDDSSLRRVIQFKLKRKGFDVVAVENGRQAYNELKANRYDLLLCDMKMPELDGLELLEKSREVQPDLQVILITAYATISQAVEAIKLGAFDYLTKPFEDGQLFAVIDKALRFKMLEDENKFLKEKLDGFQTSKNLVGVSRSFKDVLSVVNKVAPADATVLLTGESGTGKEVIAREIHRRSPRLHNPFIAVNCAAIPRELLESELFGHVKGAFTGAIKDKKGKFELANGGTLLLDEISELNIELQAKLLRVIQQRVVEPVGAETNREIDIRLIASTNVDLKKHVVEKKFREDLFYRLNIIPIRLPSLRERTDDIPILLKEFLHRFSPDQPVEIDNRLFSLLTEYSWPGNIRELENLAERMVIMRKSNLLTSSDLPADFGKTGTSHDNGIMVDTKADGKLTFHEAEKRLVIEALEKFSWNKAKAARYLDIPRHILIYRMKKYGLRNPDNI
jgi:DNA-binding NtrC family response regulator